MYSNFGTGTVPKITRRNILNHRDNIPNNISNNLEQVGMESQSPCIDTGSKTSDSNDTTSLATNKDAMPSNVQQNQDRNSDKKNAEDAKFSDRRQVEDKLEQIREYISITSALVSNMRKADEQNDPTLDDSERLDQMVHDLKDSEHKLIRILENWNHNVQHNQTPYEAEIAVVDCSTTTASVEVVDYKDEAACLELQKPLIAEPDVALQQSQSSELDLNNADNSARNLSANQTDMIQELEDRLANWKKTQFSRMNLEENLETQVEILGDTISHLTNGSETRRDIMDILDQKDCSLQAEHVSLQNKLVELQSKKQQVDHLVEQLHVLNGLKSEDEDVGNQVRRIVSMKDQLSKLKDMLHSIQNIETTEKPPTSESSINPPAFMDNIPPSESMDASLSIRNDVRNSADRFLVPGPSQDETNVRRNTHKQVNKKSTNSIDRQRSLQAELQAKKHELEELMSKRKATSNLNHDGNSEKSSLGLYYNPYNHHKEQLYSSDEADSDDEVNDLNLSIESLTKNQIPQSQQNQQHLIPERLSSISSSNCHNSTVTQQTTDWQLDMRQQQLLMEEERSQSEARKGIFMVDPNSYARQQRGVSNGQLQDATKMQRIQMQKQLELIRNVCDSMLMENIVTNDQEDTFNNHQPSINQQPQSQSFISTRKNHTPSPLYSEPLSCNNTCSTPDNQNLNVAQDHNNPLAGMLPTASGRTSSKVGSRRSNGAGVDSNEGIQTMQGSRNVKPASCQSNLDQTSNVWQQQQQWLVNNTLQSQAFIMNTLNQCCQMMWLQQREIQSLRNAVQNMQMQNQHQTNNASSSSNNQQRSNGSTLNQFPGSGTPYINTSGFAYPLAGPSLVQQQSSPAPNRAAASYPSNSDPNCSVAKSNPNIMMGMLPNLIHSFPAASFPNAAPPMMGESLDVNHTADYVGSRASNSAQHVHRPNMAPMSSDCLNNCSNNNLSNVNMNNVMHGGNNLASNSNPQIWHERSLNNQVNQGSRANNYWDNFRR